MSRTGRAFRNRRNLRCAARPGEGWLRVERGAGTSRRLCRKRKEALRVSQMVMFALVGCLCVQDVRASVLAATATCSRLPCMLRFLASVATLCSFLENAPSVFDAFGSSSPSARCFVSRCFPSVLCLVLCLEAGPPAAFALGCWKPLRAWKTQSVSQARGCRQCAGPPMSDPCKPVCQPPGPRWMRMLEGPSRCGVRR